MSQTYDYDLFVIGAGSGGVRAGRLAAMTGARVAVAEEYRVGGTCVVRGCVPKKFMVYASEYSHHFLLSESYGWSPISATFDWTRFITAKDVEIARLSGLYVANLSKAGARLLYGRAVLKDAHTIEMTGDDAGTYTAERILIATGGRPVKPTALDGIEHAITSEEAFHLPELPKRVTVVGAGYIAVEFAGIFNGLGSEVTLVYRGENILRGFDDDVRRHVAEEMERRGIRIILGITHRRIEKTDTGLVNHLSNDTAFETDQVMFATGRAPYVGGLGLDAAGVALNAAGAVQVDDYSRTNVANIWAVGDVTDRINLTPVAIREAAAFVSTEFHRKPMSFEHADVATAVFSQPPIGTVGLSEGDARKQYGEVDIYMSRFRPMKISFASKAERALVKLVVEPDSDRILGVHVVGPDAPEIIQMAAVALKLGVTKAQWDSTCAVHPTLAEELVTLREKSTPTGLSVG